MKIFVAGATGVLGRATIPRLVAAGHDVTGIARSADAARRLEAAGARAARVSLFDPSALEEAVAGHDAVINLATAIPSGADATKSEAWAENNRVRSEGSTNLAAAARAAGATVYIQESIAFLYADHGQEWVPPDAELADSIWTDAVKVAEANAHAFADAPAGRRGVVLRFGGFYTADSEHTRLLYKAASRGVSIDLGRHDGYFPAIHVDDAAAAVLAAVEAPTGTYDIVDSEPMDRRQQARVWSQVLNRTVRRLPVWMSRFAGVAGPAGQRSMRVSNRRFRAATGWEPAYPSIRDSLPAVVEQLGGPPPRLGAVVRAGLWALFLIGVSAGIWIEVDPRHFYDEFPFSRGWVAADGPYNEHLVRDYGAMNLALATATLGALVAGTRGLAVTAAAAWTAFGIPHFIYHLHHLDLYDGFDVAGNAVGTASTAVLPVLLLLGLARRRPRKDGGR